MQGLGAGIAGALVGGLAAKQFGNKKNNERDMIIGALVGGLGANAAENKWRDWKEEKERDQRYDSRDSYGRSKSAMR